MSPRSRGRPPGRGRQRTRRSATTGRGSRDLARPPDADPTSQAGGAIACWFDEPIADDRRSWAIPSGHGTYRGIELEFLDPADEDELMLLLEAQHAELADALDSAEEMIADGEPFSPRLHVAMHQIVANQLLADDPTETWQTVRRLASMGYDWHNIMHMIARVISDDLYRAINQHRQIDLADYARRLQRLPGDWPPP